MKPHSLSESTRDCRIRLKCLLSAGPLSAPDAPRQKILQNIVPSPSFLQYLQKREKIAICPRHYSPRVEFFLIFFYIVHQVVLLSRFFHTKCTQRTFHILFSMTVCGMFCEGLLSEFVKWRRAGERPNLHPNEGSVCGRGQSDARLRLPRQACPRGSPTLWKKKKMTTTVAVIPSAHLLLLLLLLRPLSAGTPPPSPLGAH